MAPPRHDPSSYHHGDLASALISAAADLLESEGAGQVSLRRVARAAGVSHAAPYRHFRDKQALLEAVAASGFDELAARFDEIVADAFDRPAERILAASRAYTAQVLRRPERSHLMFGGALGPEAPSAILRDAAARSFQSLLGLVRKGQAEGIFRPDLTTFDVAMTLWPATHGLAMLAAAGQIDAIDSRLEPLALAERMATLLLDGLSG